MPSLHQETDANAKAITIIAFTSLATLTALLCGLYGLFSAITGHIKPTEKAPHSLIAERQGPKPPLLESNPWLAKKKRIENERKMLESYEWFDRERGIARIPIEQAIEILAYEH